MILFWLLFAIMVAVALAFVLPPLLQTAEKSPSEGGDARNAANLSVYRDQLAELAREKENGLIGPEQYQLDRDELERRLLDDVSASSEGASDQTRPLLAGRNLVYAIALGLPLIAVALYLRVGNLNAMSASPTSTQKVEAPTASPPAASPMEGQVTQEQIEANVAALAKRLEENPGDLQGWMMLGRSYMSLERYADASSAYAKAAALKADDADLLADYAFALAMANGQSLQGEPTEIINKALKIDPENAKVIELAGSAAFQAKDYKRALEYWQKLQVKVSPESEVGRALAERIAEAKALAAK